ncbi:RES family NAD+ phosphorylase [Methylophilus aquaticus]|uniref:RES family NAD+ phosphorylase n=1 Tax=Methylophilus aquaticus TaxID=1971610 RepID=A0ABT9JWI4_9PROT|nr:RES family NAD+ phosphorylase [Methylophilus aquaticus]MDP8568935.1 RES family NAD+ phosphorylase [Methylophilus aquaticus]
MVEAQHIASTMKLVDTEAEQTLLETLLDSNKPSYAANTQQLDYLLATPFRYPSRADGSRFRGPNDPGVFYVAETVRTAAAELGYWRWRFLMDAPALSRIEPVPHTAFQLSFATQAIDLRNSPFNQDPVWQHKTNYQATQALAVTAKDVNLGAIIYTSVRDPQPAWCVAVLTPQGFKENAPRPEKQTWWLAVNTQEVIWRRDYESFTFNSLLWQ